MISSFKGVVESYVHPFFPQWPLWALNLLITLLFLLLLSQTLTSSPPPPTTPSSSSKNSKTSPALRAKYATSKNLYLLLYATIMLADWLQGTHMYTLYLSYNVNISLLFLTGFLSGAIFAPFLGSVVDRFGRKKSCIVYCLLEIVINVMEHYNNVPILIAGRILGGISTNLLFTAFESHMTTHHRLQKFPQEWLQETHASTSVLNGIMAISAGIIAQLLEDKLGHIGPFQGAIFLTVLAMVFVQVMWVENYGIAEEKKKGKEKEKDVSSFESLKTQFLSGWLYTLRNKNVLKIGLIQALTEGSTYTFVFLWVPTLLPLAPQPHGLPTGLVFSCLMIAITIGGIIQPYTSKLLNGSVEKCASYTYLLACISMFVPAYSLTSTLPSLQQILQNFDISTSLSQYIPSSNNFYPIILSFLLIEVTVGLSSPSLSTLRSRHIPDNLQATILNIYRLPLNFAVVIGTSASGVFDGWGEGWEGGGFWMCGVAFGVAAIVQASMVESEKTNEKKKLEVEVDDEREGRKKNE